MELFDPSTGAFSPAGNMVYPRLAHTATLLPNGKVLLAGGMVAFGTPTATSELFDPATGTCTPTKGVMTTARSVHNAVLLPSGKVLILGGTSSLACEYYDPETDTFSPTPGSLNFVRSYSYGFSSTLLKDGRVLVSGDHLPAECFDPATGWFQSTGASLGVPRYGVGTALLPDGKVLFAGGYEQVNQINTTYAIAETFDPVAGAFAVTGLMVAPVAFQGTAALFDGRVLVSGGEGNNGGIPQTQATYDAGDAAPGFPAFAYVPACHALAQGRAIQPITPKAAGSYSWGVTPALPDGLMLDPGTGTISGSPTGRSAAKAYAIKASNGTNSNSTWLWLTVN
jgi:hypothetical protein